MERRLAAILVADVVGYTRLMGDDEAGTLGRLTELREQVLEPLITKHHGRVVKLMGDGLLVEFASVVDALACAVAWQTSVAEREAAADEGKRFKFRIGINLGDVIVKGDDIHGDGVNIAARLESLADPGGICLSGDAYRQAKGKVEVDFEDLGEHDLKNVAEPVRVYRTAGDNSGTGAAPRATEPLPLPDKPFIAVLPFTNMSGDPEQEYFSDGITEDIITELSRFRSLFVIARNSSFTYKGRAVKAQDVGRELGVAFVVEGSVRRAGERIRVTTQLIETASGSHVWAERFDRDIQDIFAVQDEITRTIAATIGGRVEAEGRQRAVRAHPSSLKAYDYVLRAQAFYNQVSKQAHSEARPLLERAIEIDPHNARAHMLLGAIHDMASWTGWTVDPDHSLALAIRHGRTAILLDDTDSLAHAHLGEALLHHLRHSEAESHFDRALELNPNDIAARALYASFLTATERADQSLEQLEIARHLDPFGLYWIPWLRAEALFVLHRYDEAVTALQQVDAPINNARGLLAACLAQAGRLDEARTTLREFLTVAEREMAVLPERLEDWEAFWRRESSTQGDDHMDHLLDGLRKAGLEE